MARFGHLWVGLMMTVAVKMVAAFDPGLVTTLEQHMPSCGGSYEYYPDYQNQAERTGSEEQPVQEQETELVVGRPSNANCSLGQGPNMLLLGATGVGKSTLGNLLLGVNKGLCRQRGECLTCNRGWCKTGQCLQEEAGVCITCKAGQCRRRRGACAEFACLHRDNYKVGDLMGPEEELPFQPGGGIDSVTMQTKAFSGPYLGDGPCVTLIDTPGAGDTEGRDYQHAIKMAQMLKENIKTIDVIIIMFKGTDRRFDTHTVTLLRLYEEIFGKEMWRNVVVEISYWGHSQADTCQRLTNYQPPLNEETQTRDINQKVSFKKIAQVFSSQI